VISVVVNFFHAGNCTSFGLLHILVRYLIPHQCREEKE
jgi:hypothetical protein